MSAGRAPVPEPVLDADGDVAMFSGEITAALHRPGGLWGCLVCAVSSSWAWPVAAVAGRVAGDGSGRVVPPSWAGLPGEVGLHPACVPGLLTEQGWMVHGDGGLPGGDGAAPSAGAPRASSGRAGRVGAYGRRRGL